MHLGAQILRGRCILDGLLLIAILSVTILFTLSLSFQLVEVFVDHRGCGHTGVTAFNHTGLTALDDILIHLDRTKPHQFVEAHDGLLYIERFSQIVIGAQFQTDHFVQLGIAG